MSDPLQRSPAVDLVIAGAARSGTSFLAAQLSSHPNIDAGSIKEPNFFSRNYERGFDWYDSLFQRRADGLLRMDASVSYTFPHFPEALDRLSAHAPTALVVYVVRDPIPRAVSHYLYYRHYFEKETATDFGAAIRENAVYVGASDYQRWLGRLSERFQDRLLVVPFSAVTAGQVDAYVCARLELPPPPAKEQQAEAHKNSVVTFKHEAFRVASRKLRRSRLYPIVRERLGAHRLRKLRSLVTRDTTLPSLEEALSSCSAQQRSELAAIERRSRDAASAFLAEQDQRTGMAWLPLWPNGRIPDE